MLTRFIRALAKAIAAELPGRKPPPATGDATAGEHPTVRTQVADVWILPGQSLTVWLGKHDDAGGRTQVELRVLRGSGNRELYLDYDVAVEVREFEEWTAPE